MKLARNVRDIAGKIGNVSNADVLWNNILNQNIKYGPHIRIWETTLFSSSVRLTTYLLGIISSFFKVSAGHYHTNICLSNSLI